MKFPRWLQLSCNVSECHHYSTWHTFNSFKVVIIQVSSHGSHLPKQSKQISKTKSIFTVINNFIILLYTYLYNFLFFQDSVRLASNSQQPSYLTSQVLGLWVYITTPDLCVQLLEIKFGLDMVVRLQFQRLRKLRQRNPIFKVN